VQAVHLDDKEELAWYPLGQEMQDVGEAIALYLPGVQGVHIPSSCVAPSKVVVSVAEALLNLAPIGQVAFVML
jgi:hypothetical protein